MSGPEEGRVPGEEAARTERVGPDVPVSMSSEAFRRAGHALVDRVAELLEGLPDRPVTPGADPEAVRDRIGASTPLPEEGADPERVLEEAADLLIDGSLYNGHPRFFGYITASPAPIGMLGDLLAAAVNPNCGGWTLSPTASEMEGQTVRWIADLLGYPTDCGGLLVSGGNMANLVCFWAARDAAGDGFEIQKRGLGAPDAPRLRVYVSAETHTWVQKAADLSGLGTDAVRWIATDDGLRMEPDALRRALEEDRQAGFRPFMVVGTAGTVSTGAVDPLPELARLCRREGLWFHVDGAYGGFAAAVPSAPADMAGLAEADSVAVDPHKWLYAPLEAGCALVRRPEDLRNAFAYHPPYYYFGVEATNYLDFGPQNSRGFRALKVWLALSQAGRRGYVRLIEQDMALARRLFRRAGEHPELEALTVALSIATFRYVPPDLKGRVGEEAVESYLNDLNQRIQDRLEKRGEVFVSNAVIRGRYALRACIVNFNTTTGDVDALPEVVVRVGREVHAEADDVP